MSRTTALVIGVAAVALAARIDVAAQTKVIPGEHRTATATVETVDGTARKITLRLANGEMRTITAPSTMARFNEIKPGQTVTATYYDNIIVRKKAADEADVDTFKAVGTTGDGALPSGAVAAQQTITATVEAIDMNIPSITLKGPREFRYATKVQDKNALEQLKVGDRLDITWTEATLVSVAPGDGKTAK